MRLATRSAGLLAVFSGHRHEKTGSGGIRLAGIVSACLLMVVAAGSATADQIALTDGNSTLQIDTGTALGAYGWTVSGVNHLSQQTTWYRIGAAGGEALLASLPQTALSVAGNTATVQYTDPRFRIDATYTTHGGAPGTADIHQIYTISNIGGGLLDLHLFQYNDFDVDGEFDNNQVSITGGNTATQTGPLGGAVVSVAGRSPSRYEAAVYSHVLDGLTDLSPTALANVAGPIFGDGTYGFQWDITLGPGGVTQFTLDTAVNAIPEPAGLAFLALGMALFSGRYRGNRRRIGR